MYKVTVRFTRPSTDIPFWQPTASDILFNQENYGFIRNRSVSEDGLQMTLDTYCLNKELWDVYSNDPDMKAREARNTYNAEHGITKETLFAGEVDE